MTLRLFLCGTLALASCVPVREAERPVSVPAIAVPKPFLPPVVAPSSPVSDPQASRVTLSGITFEGVLFDSRSHRLRVVEQGGEPGSHLADAVAAAREIGGLAAVNGGFFTPEGEPLGLVISNGRRFGAWNGASALGSGVWHASADGHSAINRRETLGKDRASTMHELMQAGPLLVWRGSAVGGLEAAKTSARTLILWDGGHRWWIGRSSPCTLARCAEVLATSSPVSWPVHHALNLDGGRSSDLWVSPAVQGGPITNRPPWNRPVRNFLVLVPAS
jgi:hypothetical protein